jgi:type II secretory ATPase GspE/PulE/Tfp pilus assembly ATPase PilB-like protein
MIRFVNQIISEAIRRNATDIHLEPFESHLRLRYRIDGIMQEIPLPKGIQKFRKAVASCVKIMAELDIAERRKPHDGRIKVRSGNEEFDLRVSILPTRYGETVNMRILNRSAMFIDLQHLGLGEDQRPVIEALSSLPHGVILITGPTGSGKTTTLYATLSRLNTQAVKIITVEDPIEYQMEGINQIQVHPKIDLTFATILRSILRHDPDIILIGEIRDSDTADIAVRASLTGHLVFSTLHTNDAPSAITRLSDMGIEPYLVSSCLEGVIAQRLVRRICPVCKERMEPDDSVLEELRQTLPGVVEGAAFYKGRGCPECSFTGYHGRLAIFEIMVINDALRAMIVKQRPSNEIRHQAEADGFVTLRKDAWKRALRGDTSIEEVMRVTRRAELSRA